MEFAFDDHCPSGGKTSQITLCASYTWRTTTLSALIADELLLRCFFLSAMAYFCAFWRTNTNTKSVDRLTHPVPLVRINYVIRVAEMWCSRNDSLPREWFEPTKFRSLFSCASQVIDGDSKQSWSAQIETWQSNEGIEYDRLLLTRFEEMRRKSP